MAQKQIKEPEVQKKAEEIGEGLRDRPLAFVIGVLSLVNLAVMNNIRDAYKEKKDGVPTAE